MPISYDDLTKLFTYHPPKPGQIERYRILREAALEFAKAIVASTPTSADQTVAIRHVREAVMNANAAIALED